MQNKIVAISTAVADAVRETMRAPVYGFLAHKELVTDAAPCRHCLRLITPQVDEAILFIYDRFTGVEELPQPGPIYVHAKECSRYHEHDGRLLHISHRPDMRLMNPLANEIIAGIRDRLGSRNRNAPRVLRMQGAFPNKTNLTDEPVNTN